MAAIKQQQFVNILKSLNIDLSEFSDLSFDNICEEPSIQPLLSWFSSSFDCDNVLADEETDKLSLIPDDETLHNLAGEQLENNDLEMYQNLLTSVETRLDRCRQSLSDARLLDYSLSQKEKSHRENFKKRESSNSALLSHCGSDVLTEVDKTLEVCLSTQPYVPNIADFNEECGNLKTALHNFYNLSVFNVKQSIETDEENSQTGIDNLEQVLLESQVEEELNILRLEGALAWLTNGARIADWQAVQNMNRDAIDVQKALVTVRGKLRSRESCYLKKKIDCFNYLQSALTLNRELTLESYLSLLISQSFVETRLAAGVDHSASIRLLENFLKDIETNISKSLDVPVVERTFPIVMKSSGVEEIQQYDALIKLLRAEYEHNKPFREQIETVLTSLRTGPTLRFNIIPTKLLFTLYDCQLMRKRLHQSMSQLAGLYVAKKAVKNPERWMDLLWVSFLNDH